MTSHVTHYCGYDIVHATDPTDWFTVTTKKGEHYFDNLRHAMDFIDELHNA